MSYAPESIKDLEAYWKKQGGVALGIVGDASHANKGTSYHLGKDLLLPGAYSARTKRDRDGLSNAASAIDLGRLDGSLTKLRRFSRWFAQQCMDGKPYYNDVREVIFWSDDRNRVIGWSALDPKKWINDYGDSSHKTHTHISFYRDSEKDGKVGMFRPYFPAPKPPAPKPEPEPEEEMILSQSLPGYTTTLKATANVRETPELDGKVIRVVTTPENWTIIGAVKGDKDPEGGSDQWYVHWLGNRWEYTAASNVIARPVAPASQVELARAKSEAAACSLVLMKVRDAVAR